jgi:hypothetical protein
MVIWIIYLRYLLAKKSIESQAEVNKYRLQLEMASDNRQPLELVYAPQQNENGVVADWNKEETVKGDPAIEPGGTDPNHDLKLGT